MADENGTTTAEETPKPAPTRRRPAAKAASTKKKEITLSPYKLYKLAGKVMTLVAEVEADSAEGARTKADEKVKALAGEPLVVVATRNMKTLTTETVTRTSVKAV